MSATPHVCPLCTGDGDIPPVRNGLTTVDQRVKCRACDGKGIVWEPPPQIVQHQCQHLDHIRFK